MKEEEEKKGVDRKVNRGGEREGCFRSFGSGIPYIRSVGRGEFKITLFM